MIDWWVVAANSLWILGLSVLLAAWSLASYESRVGEQTVRQIFARAGYRRSLMVGVGLFFAGLAATDDRPVVRILWIVLGLITIVQLGLRQRPQSEE